MKGTEQNLTVAVRIRPHNDQEKLLGAGTIAYEVENNMVVLLDPTEDPDDILRANRTREKRYVFDYAFGPNTTQAEVYEKTTKGLIENVINGYNATVFAYGATGAGKTYTMLGRDDNIGIMALALNDLFLEMERTKNHMVYKVKMSYLEIYNEMIRDLLDPSLGYLELREDAKGVQIANLSEVEASTTEEVMEKLTQGNAERTQEPTAANKTSSRSHAILQVTVRQTHRLPGNKKNIRCGKLFLIDLAGSERASNTHNRGKRMVEGAHINRSLLALGNCINALCDKNGSRYVNYRDSKLTRLLKDSLGGNCKTVMIAHTSPASLHFEESRNTLLYADRAKHIKTKVNLNNKRVSYHVSQYNLIITELRNEVVKLKMRLAEQEDTNDHDQAKGPVTANIQMVQSEVLRSTRSADRKELDKLKADIVTAFKDQMNLRTCLMDINIEILGVVMEMEDKQELIKGWEAEKMKYQRRQESDSDSDRLKDNVSMISVEDIDEPQQIKNALLSVGRLMAEKQRLEDAKDQVELHLAEKKQKVAALEERLPSVAGTDDQQEVLSLLCRVHELEINNTEMQTKLLLSNHELNKRDKLLRRHQERKSLHDDIIQMQRTLIHDNNIQVSEELERLYEHYDLDPFIESTELPPINSRVPSMQNLQMYRQNTSLSALTYFDMDQLQDKLNRVQEEKEQDDINEERNRGKRKFPARRVSDSIAELEKDNRYEDTDKLFLPGQKNRQFHSLVTMNNHDDSSSNPRSARMSLNSVNLHGNNQSNTDLKVSKSDSQANPPIAMTQSKHSLKSSSDEEKVITHKTRNIVALAAIRRTKAQIDMVNMDRLNTPVQTLETNESYLSPSALARHNNRYGNSVSSMRLNDAEVASVTTGHSVEQGQSNPRLHKGNMYTRQGMRKQDKNNNIDTRNQKGQQDPPSRIAQRKLNGPNGQSKSSNSLYKTQRRRNQKDYGIRKSTMKFPVSHGADRDLIEMESAITPPITIHQNNSDRGQGMTIRKQIRGPLGTSSDSSNSSTPQNQAGSRARKPPPTIPNYRKGNIAIMGFSLQH
ncbi:unnamed protein product [Owenia fusiformis]|uniref:Kinesin-like protein KIN-8B n=1 Tax=Owenia fusiformis TaxID=6347 RepID=A0A8J1U6R3_OWEFU|nr:unnamed protein product [Owenia fusiformis]